MNWRDSATVECLGCELHQHWCSEQQVSISIPLLSFPLFMTLSTMSC